MRFRLYSSFNSLQTGNHIQRKIVGEDVPVEVMFQFPSNGKPYPKPPQHQRVLAKRIRSFNSLQTGNHIQRCISRRWCCVVVGFNSLQTGNHIQSAFMVAGCGAGMSQSFNSLQTGNHIQSHNRHIHKDQWVLFQFPSNGKPYPKLLRYLRQHRQGRSFNSLQTGNHIQSLYYNRRRSTGNHVSIPFKRETISKGNLGLVRVKFIDVFQFPSNGKPYPKMRQVIQWQLLPRFQFPSNGKPYPKEVIVTTPPEICSIVSIPFKRETISKGGRQLKPSWQRRVSIPFKRETISKADALPSERLKEARFNSLQTGNHIQR